VADYGDTRKGKKNSILSNTDHHKTMT
jgi:hypothetical protein